jgi:hypothetical protein
MLIIKLKYAYDITINSKTNNNTLRYIEHFPKKVKALEEVYII